jgi:hypothetical protein
MSTRAGSEGLDARELKQDRWEPFFEGINRRLEDGADIQASLEIVSPDIVGPAAEHMPLDSITHEDGDDEIVIGLGGRGQKFPAALWHFVSEPRQVWIMERDGERGVIAIQSEDGTRTLLHLQGAGPVT